MRQGALYIIRCAWDSAKQSLLLPFILPILLLSLLTGCERRPLEEDSYDKALIPITIDWVTLAKLDPATDHDNLYRASVWFFSKDGAVFNGKSYKEFLLNDPRGGTLELPVGHYSILILNNSVDDFNGNVGFRGTDSYSTFEYYLKSASGSLNSMGQTLGLQVEQLPQVILCLLSCLLSDWVIQFATDLYHLWSDLILEHTPNG